MQLREYFEGWNKRSASYSYLNFQKLLKELVSSWTDKGETKGPRASKRSQVAPLF